MGDTTYLSVEEVLDLHESVIERFGGTRGVRDPGLVESALARPRSGYYESLSQQAAALLQSFAMNHAFVDGNKRVAFACCAVFLRLNGYRLEVGPDDAERLVVAEVIEGHADLDHIVSRLEQWMRRLTPST